MVKGHIPATCIILDIKLNLHLLNNEALIMGMRTVPHQDNVYKYTVMKSTNQVGNHPLLKLDAWFDPHGIANLLSLAIVARHYHVALETMESFFTVHLQDQGILFRKCERGMSYFNKAAASDFYFVIITFIDNSTP